MASDAEVMPDAVVDTGVSDDAGGADAEVDGGVPDASVDSGPLDSSMDDAGTPPVFECPTLTTREGVETNMPLEELEVAASPQGSTPLTLVEAQLVHSGVRQAAGGGTEVRYAISGRVRNDSSLPVCDSFMEITVGGGGVLLRANGGGSPWTLGGAVLPCLGPNEVGAFVATSADAVVSGDEAPVVTSLTFRGFGLGSASAVASPAPLTGSNYLVAGDELMSELTVGASALDDIFVGVFLEDPCGRTLAALYAFVDQRYEPGTTFSATLTFSPGADWVDLSSLDLTSATIHVVADLGVDQAR